MGRSVWVGPPLRRAEPRSGQKGPPKEATAMLFPSPEQSVSRSTDGEPGSVVVNESVDASAMDSQPHLSAMPGLPARSSILSEACRCTNALNGGSFQQEAMLSVAGEGRSRRPRARCRAPSDAHELTTAGLHLLSSCLTFCRLAVRRLVHGCPWSSAADPARLPGPPENDPAACRAGCGDVRLAGARLRRLRPDRGRRPQRAYLPVAIYASFASLSVARG
jgi:hypothetical protein